MAANFVGRAAELKEMRRSAASQENCHRASILVLEGLGGIGKTQLALEYAVRNRKLYTAVFWINAKSERTLQDALASCAERIPLNNVLDGNGELLQAEHTIKRALKAVLNWLELPENSKWLLIFDNVDSHISISSPGGDAKNSYDIRRYIPSAAHGTILITTRLSRLSQLGKAILVKEINTRDGMEIFCASAGLSSECNEVQGIVTRLRGYPLAISQAGGYVRQTGISATKYLKQFDSYLTGLMQEEQNLTYENGSISSSWRLSFEEVKIRNSDSARLLLLWGFLDNSDIWWDMFRLAEVCENKKRLDTFLRVPLLLSGHGEQKELLRDDSGWLSALASNEPRFLSAIRILRDFSFASPLDGTDGYSLHPVLHGWARSQVDPALWTSYLDATAALLGRAAPLAHTRDAWATQRRLTLHVKRFWSLFDEHHNKDSILPDGLNGLALFEFDQSNPQRARMACEIACRGWEHILGPDHFQTIECLVDMACTYYGMQQYGDADKVWDCIVSKYGNINGPIEKLIARSLDALGRSSARQGKMECAVDYFCQTLIKKKKIFGEEALSTLDTMRQLGLAHQQLGDFNEAIAVHQQVLAGFERELGSNNTWTLLAINDLGSAHGRKGDLQLAEKLLRSAYETMRTQLGHSNSKTIEIMHNLSAVYRGQKRLDADQLLLSDGIVSSLAS
ncbi:hypothetical protein N0V90_010673 [Kalmusia sp. IMI 367209]|nr:hypothetical protein N0V90_010673 [Kalmusia sp. IMI 367209]